MPSLAAAGYPDSNSPEWYALKAAKRRCSGEDKRCAHDYAERGIAVCAEWSGKDGFKKFFEHVGHRPSPAHSLDRIDNSRGYEPGNVRWATRETQQRNRRYCRQITWNGRTMTITEWERELGLAERVLARRLQRGWSLDRAMKP